MLDESTVSGKIAHIIVTGRRLVIVRLLLRRGWYWQEFLPSFYLAH